MNAGGIMTWHNPGGPFLDVLEFLVIFVLVLILVRRKK